jgi:hypothetical protein
MSSKTMTMVDEVYSAFEGYDEDSINKIAETVFTQENYIDEMHEEISAFLMSCYKMEETTQLIGVKINKLLQITSGIEALSDECASLVHSLQKYINKNPDKKTSSYEKLLPYMTQVIDFFDYVSQQASGSYYGKEQGASRLKENIDGINMSDIQQIVDFTALINHDLFHDKRDGQCSCRIVDDQLKKGHTKQELYDFIYGMDYIIPFFQLKMNDKPLSSLSPGERGALLLLLYLFIDMDDKPLIIDQPEENLDNESVFKYLVHFIKVAKQKRQIIMVTHNPNLAVVCDADQIILMKIDKLNGNAVTFESGDIENPKINKIIVDILEGTYPAFHNRDCKYFDKSLNFRQ